MMAKILRLAKKGLFKPNKAKMYVNLPEDIIEKLFYKTNTERKEEINVINSFY